MLAFALAATGWLHGQNQSDALHIDDNGNVGIGTSKPDFKLDVSGTLRVLGNVGNSSKLLLISNTNNGTDAQAGIEMRQGSNSGQIFQQGNTYYLWNNADGPMNFVTNGKTRMYISGDGKVTVGAGIQASSLLLSGSPEETKFDDQHTAYITALRLTHPAAGAAALNLKFKATRDQYRIGFGPDGDSFMFWSDYSTGNGYVSGNLGVGIEAPEAKLDVQGTARVRGVLQADAGVVQTSDLRLKMDLQPIPSALDKIRDLRGVTYRWNGDALRYFTQNIETTLSAGPQATEKENHDLWQKERLKRYQELRKTQIGVVAQDVEAVLPEAVTTDAAGYKQVAYHELIPLLIEAIKEQDKISKEQAQTIARQQSEIQRLARANDTAQEQLAELSELKQKFARLENALNQLVASGYPADEGKQASAAAHYLAGSE
jgi:hypothetical protein